MAQLLNSKDCERVFNGYRKQVARFNSYLKDVIKQVGSNEVYLDKSSTIISAPTSVWPIEEVKPDGPGCELLHNDGTPELVFRQKYVWPEYSTGGIIKKEEYCVYSPRDRGRYYSYRKGD